jgi:hypothetical protein
MSSKEGQLCKAALQFMSNKGPRSTSGWRAGACSRHFIAQILPPRFYWQRQQSRPPGGRSGAARRRLRALIPGKKDRRVGTAIGSERSFGLTVTNFALRIRLCGQTCHLKVARWTTLLVSVGVTAVAIHWLGERMCSRREPYRTPHHLAYRSPYMPE